MRCFTVSSEGKFLVRRKFFFLSVVFGFVVVAYVMGKLVGVDVWVCVVIENLRYFIFILGSIF